MTVEALVMGQCEDEDAFLDSLQEACVQRIRADLGLPAANDDPPDGSPTEVVVRRRSG